MKLLSIFLSTFAILSVVLSAPVESSSGVVLADREIKDNVELVVRRDEGLVKRDDFEIKRDDIEPDMELDIADLSKRDYKILTELFTALNKSGIVVPIFKLLATSKVTEPLLAKGVAAFLKKVNLDDLFIAIDKSPIGADIVYRASWDPDFLVGLYNVLQVLKANSTSAGTIGCGTGSSSSESSGATVSDGADSDGAESNGAKLSVQSDSLGTELHSGLQTSKLTSYLKKGSDIYNQYSGAGSELKQVGQSLDIGQSDSGIFGILKSLLTVSGARKGSKSQASSELKSITSGSGDIATESGDLSTETGTAYESSEPSGVLSAGTSGSTITSGASQESSPSDSTPASSTAPSTTSSTSLPSSSSSSGSESWWDRITGLLKRDSEAANSVVIKARDSEVDEFVDIEARDSEVLDNLFESLGDSGLAQSIVVALLEDKSYYQFILDLATQIRDDQAITIDLFSGALNASHLLNDAVVGALLK